MATKEEIRNFLKSTSFKEDRWGNFKSKSGDIRYKISKTSLRKERKLVYDSGGSTWIKVYSAYYKNMIIENGKMKIIKRN